KHDFDDGRQRENRPSVGTDEAVEPVEKIEEKLANDLKYSKIHDLGFVVIELSETMVEFGSCPNFEARTISLAGRQLKTRHPQCAGKSVHFLFRRNIETAAPHPVGFRGQRRDERGKKWIADRCPIGLREVLLIKRPRRALPHSEQSAPPAEPIDIDPLRLAVEAPNESGVIRIIFRVNRRR